ncbi:MAG TPA: GNAT family N-acetyltransferase [Vicinamibacterales bacterium]|nr:GNAT family N-acetyltransferase [Vicinamibacterales bacterium]
MRNLVEAEGPILDRVLDDTYEIWNDGLSRHAYARFYTAQMATAWGRTHLRRLALVNGEDIVASAKLYQIDATLDGVPLKVAGIGAVFTSPAARGRGAARELIGRLLERAAADGAGLALLFSEIGPGYYARLGFEPIATVDRQLRVTESTRYGAPITMVRGGDDRDLKDIVALDSARAEPFRFHLTRDRDLVQFAIARKRLLAGLGSPGARAVHFFVAEEGASAVAYVVIGVQGNQWTIEEVGDRDPGGARVGAILQALIAREPADKRPSIKAWLPEGFLPPQLTIVGEKPSAELMMIKAIGDRGREHRRLEPADLLYWHADLF